MRLAATRILGIFCAILAGASALWTSANETRAAPRGGVFRPAMPMHQQFVPPAAMRPTANPATGRVVQSPQVGNSVIRLNLANTLINSRMAANNGFTGFVSGFGAFSTPVPNGFTPAINSAAFHSGPPGSFNGFNGFNTGLTNPGNFNPGLILNGFNNLNGFNTFAPANGFNTFNPAMNGLGTNAKLGFNGGNGL